MLFEAMSDAPANPFQHSGGGSSVPPEIASVFFKVSIFIGLLAVLFFHVIVLT